MARNAIYIGSTVTGAPNGTDYFSPVKIPGNMSKQATIDAHVEKVRAEREEHNQMQPLGYAGSILPNDDVYENHAHRPMAGMLASVHIVDANGDILYQQDTDATRTIGQVAVPFVSYLKEKYTNQFSHSLRSADISPDAHFFGFNLKQVLRIAAFEVFRYNQENGVDIDVPIRLWHNPPGVYDVKDILLSTNDQRDLDLYSLLRYFNVEANVEELSTSALAQARVSRELAKRTQLSCVVG